MRYLYTLLLALSMPFVVARLLWRSLKLPAYKYRLKERFGIYPTPALTQKSIWVHTVSVGEFIAATPLIKALLKRYPTQPIVVTATTPSGSLQITNVFGDQVHHVYAPMDLPGSCRRAIAHINPAICIILETELWPNLLHLLKKHKVPAMLANGRLSARSARGYAKARQITHDMLNCFSVLATQCAADGERYVALGLDEKKLQVLGNIKFDITVDADLPNKGAALKQTFGDRFVIAAASTHEGEEEPVLDAFKQVKAKYPNALLLLVPRHPDRFDKVANLCQSQGLTVTRRSTNEAPGTTTDIFLGDTMGELKLMFAASDCAYVGGSLVPTGGHNFIEPAILGVPCLSGPHLHNFVQLSELLKTDNALLIANNPNELATQLTQLINNPAERQAMGERGRQVVLQNKGALERHLQTVDLLLTAY